MTNLVIAAVSAVLATNSPIAISNLVQTQTGLVLPVTETNDPVDRALAQLMEQDNAARAEITKWIEENAKFEEAGAAVPRSEMSRRIQARLQPIRKGYETLFLEHTNRAEILVAHASFLSELGEEEAAAEKLEQARAIDPKDPAIWNNLANIYGHIGEVKKSFEFYAKAIELDPSESVYYHNFGTTVFLFRKDAKEFYDINEQQVFDKALQLYSNAIRLDPKDFRLAADVAQTFYGIQPQRTYEALSAWTNAFSLAADEDERQGVHLHFARVKLKAGRFAEAQAHLDAVTSDAHVEVKRRVQRTLDEARSKVLEKTPPAASKTATNEPGELK